MIFANQLRGLAALCVAFSHWGGVYLLMAPTVGWMTSSPNLSVGRPFILHVLQWRWLNFGSLGVAVFFLISGFVIPFSLRSNTVVQFLMARFFRIFPLFWAALFLEWLIVFAQSHLYGRSMAFRPMNYFYDALMIDTTIDSGSVDLVHWTLIVEVKFYIVAAVLRTSILRGATLPLIAFSVAALGLAIAQHDGFLRLSDDLASEPMYISFMFIGTIFYFRYSGMVGVGKAFATVATLLSFFLLCWRFGSRQTSFPTIPATYLYAIVLFGAAYFARKLFRPSRWLDFLADVSFPFYLIHSIGGYSVMSFVILRFGRSYWVAVAIAAGVVLLTAWALHKTIEMPMLSLGKRVAHSTLKRNVSAQFRTRGQSQSTV